MRRSSVGVSHRESEAVQKWIKYENNSKYEEQKQS